MTVPSTGTVGEKIEFTADASDEDDHKNYLTYTWDISGGPENKTAKKTVKLINPKAYGTATARATFQQTGTYTATLSVRDFSGKSSTKSQEIIIH